MKKLELHQIPSSDPKFRFQVQIPSSDPEFRFRCTDSYYSQFITYHYYCMIIIIYHLRMIHLGIYTSYFITIYYYYTNVNTYYIYYYYVYICTSTPPYHQTPFPSPNSPINDSLLFVWWKKSFKGSNWQKKSDETATCLEKGWIWITISIFIKSTLTFYLQSPKILTKNFNMGQHWLIVLIPQK